MKKFLLFALAGIGLLVIIGIATIGGTAVAGAAAIDHVTEQVTLDAINEYNIVKEHGSAMDAYVRAGLVAEAYLQSGDMEGYKKWKEIEKAEAKAAGLDPEVFN